jgi:hypothetical protein
MTPPDPVFTLKGQHGFGISGCSTIVARPKLSMTVQLWLGWAGLLWPWGLDRGAQSYSMG